MPTATLIPAPSETSIVHKIYKFYLAFSSAAETFPKKDRYTIAEKATNLALEILELALLAHSKEKRSKILILAKMDVKLKVLKYLVRGSLDVKAINEKKYLFLEGLLQEIGRMLGGWIKSIQQPPA